MYDEAGIKEVLARLRAEHGASKKTGLHEVATAFGVVGEWGGGRRTGHMHARTHTYTHTHTHTSTSTSTHFLHAQMCAHIHFFYTHTHTHTHTQTVFYTQVHMSMYCAHTMQSRVIFMLFL